MIEQIKELKKVKTTDNKQELSLGDSYVESIGRRKSAVARVRAFKNGSGLFMVNDTEVANYFDEDGACVANQPLKLSESTERFNVSVFVSGGGKRSQAEATRHGLARVLVLMDEELKGSFKAKSWLTRDSRKKERKKPGLKKARKAPQWSKR